MEIGDRDSGRMDSFVEQTCAIRKSTASAAKHEVDAV